MTYGLTLDAWTEMLIAQEGVCAICKEEKTKSGKLKVLCVDHIHIKGYKKMVPEDKIKYVRGLACFICNTLVGKLERSTNGRKLLTGLNEYFDEHCMKGEIE